MECGSGMCELLIPFSVLYATATTHIPDNGGVLGRAARVTDVLFELLGTCGD